MRNSKPCLGAGSRWSSSAMNLTCAVTSHWLTVCDLAQSKQLKPCVQGIGKIVMLTGDNTPTAKAIAQASGVDDVQADLLPADKVTAIENLVSMFGSVAMVGDGVNDAPAMARSSLGIAMGAAGSDTALETADIALMSDDLTRIPWLVRTLDGRWTSFG